MSDLRLLPPVAEIVVSFDQRRKMNLDLLAQSLADLNRVVEEAEAAKRRCVELYLLTLRDES